ncbi:hypothetical protein C7212DRAFT_223318 [Tuber magnatum]|uniref:Uncharacterized protein n=1 Tax=Tuber magnatum TaxID=42249 RepID=A0A317SGC9_9PEZI|nr:hypothetical protein C7212DRAFT_223318 [Tuber magnatum]
MIIPPTPSTKAPPTPKPSRPTHNPPNAAHPIPPLTPPPPPPPDPPLPAPQVPRQRPPPLHNPQPPPETPSSLPKALQKYAAHFRDRPLSHITSFLILHELTAIVPLGGLFLFFHKTRWTPPGVSGEWVVAGVERFGKYV